MKSGRISLLSLLALGGLVAFAPISRAQDNADKPKPDAPAAGQRVRRGGGGPNQADRIVEQLKLTEEQKGKVMPLLQEEGKKLRELRNDTSLNAQERREKSREIRDQYAEKIKPILTADQFAEFKKLQAQQGPGRGNRPNGGVDRPQRPAKPEADKTETK